MVNQLDQGLPTSISVPLTGSGGIVTSPWYSFFLSLWNRTGGAIANLSPLLDTISSMPGAIIFRGVSMWQGLVPGLQYQVLRLIQGAGGFEFPEWNFLDGNSFNTQSENEFFASPSGTAGIPTFRGIVGADLAGVQGQYPGTTTNDNAAPGNVGEYISSQINSPGVTFMSNVATDVTSIVLTPGDWDVWGNFVSNNTSGPAEIFINAWINTTSATDPLAPNQGAYAMLDLTPTTFATASLPVGMIRITVARTTTQTVYLSGNVQAASSTKAWGFIGARRRR